MNYSVFILGNVPECRTQAEVERSCPDGSAQLAALIFENDADWQVQLFEEPSSDAENEELDAAVAKARELLGEYVNRKGKSKPKGLTKAGLSLWLMEKADGTAMGRPYSS